MPRQTVIEAQRRLDDRPDLAARQRLDGEDAAAARLEFFAERCKHACTPLARRHQGDGASATLGECPPRHGACFVLGRERELPEKG